MPVIALTQEMGSLAKDVAEQLAARMGLGSMRHEMADHVASRMHASTSLINRLRGGQAGTLERLRTDRRGVAIFTAEEVLDTAARGDVVLRGWGATCLLRSVPHVVCARITRPLEQRVEWLMAHLETDDRDTAEAEIRRSDRAHAANMNAWFGVTWGDPLLYDAVFNTGSLSVESCVEQLAALVGRPEFAETEASRRQLEARALQARVRAALKADPATREVDITIQSEGGNVVLRGIVLVPDEHPAAARVAAQVPDVVSVDNQLRVMKPSRLFPSAKN